METLSQLLSYEFIRNAVYVALLASLLCGVIGTFVVVKRLVFLSGGLSHAAFGGLGICHFLGLEPLLGAAAVAALSGLLLSASDRGRRAGSDVGMGILWAVGMAVGVVFVFKTPGYAPNLMTYLFGNILTVDPSAVKFTLWFTLFVLAFVACFHKEFVAVAFDEEFAAVQGMPVRSFMILLTVLIALTVVLLIQLVGIVLVIALLSIPPIIGLMLARSFVLVMAIATLVGAIVSLGGLVLSYRFDLPSGPTIVLLGATLLLATRVWTWIVERLGREKEELAPAGS